MNIIHRLIKKAFIKLGYNIHKVKADDLELYYELYGREIMKEPRLFNIGAGSFYHPAWLNVDACDGYYSHFANNTDIKHNLMSLGRLPIDDNSADIIYTSHLIEHLSDKATLNLFEQAHRILKDGGCFRITCPNFELYEYALHNEDFDFFKFWIRKPFNTAAGVRLTKPRDKATITDIFTWQTDAKNSTLFPRYEDPNNMALHRNFWTIQSVTGLLRYAGFKTIYVSGYGQSRVPVLRNTLYFDNSHPQQSLYVEAFK